DEALSEGESDRLGSAVDLQLGQDSLDVSGDGLRADHEPVGDFLLLEPIGEQPQDLMLPWAQVVYPTGRSRAMGASRRGTQQAAADSSDHLLWIHRLDQIVVGSDRYADHTVKRLRSAPRDEENRKQLSELQPEGTADLEAAQPREDDVEDDERGPLLA